METVDVVIKVPKEQLERLQRIISIGTWGLMNLNSEELAILNGTVLPKGHGRLIDANEIQFENAEFDTYGDYSRAFDAVDQADTIIEADSSADEKLNKEANDETDS